MNCPHCGKDIDKAPAFETCADVWFDAFWLAYPRHVGKASALKAWKRAATSEKLKDEIMAGLKAQLQDVAWRGVNKQFIPHAATWLNGKRWEDEFVRKTTPFSLQAPTQPPGSCPTCWDTGILSITESGVQFCNCGAPHDPIFDQEGAGSAVAG